MLIGAMSRPRAICSALAIVSLLAACGSPAGSRAGANNGTSAGINADATAIVSTPVAATDGILIRGNGAEPETLDPQKARSEIALTVLRDLYECLTSRGRDGAPAPGVARDWSVTADGRAYTFHLRPDARWSNGDAVTADDFVFALRRLVDPATGSQYAQLVDVIAAAPDVIAGRTPPTRLGVVAPDAATVVVQLSAPAPYLPGLLAHPATCPVHRPTLAKAGAQFTRPGTMVSNGAFVLAEWRQGAYVLALRNRHYWNDAVTRLAGVRYLPIADESAELARYRAGELHVTSTVPRAQFEWIRSHLAGELHVSPQLSTYYYGFNLRRPVFRDARIRRALSLVIDRDKLARLILRVGEQPANGWVPPGVSNYTPQSFDYASWPMPKRIAEARRLYAAAGYSAENPLRFELRYNAGDVHTKLAIAVAAIWQAELGVEAKIIAVEFKSLLQDIDTGAVDVFRSSWVADYDDAWSHLQYLRSDFGINLPRYRSAAYDALLARASAETDPARRRATLEEAERAMLADHPLLPLYFYVNKHLVKPQVRGWRDDAMNVVYSRDLSLAP